MLAILIVRMSTVVIEPAVQMESALLVGQALTALSLHDPKDMAIIYSDRWNTGTNPDLTFVSFVPISRIPDRCILESSLSHNIDPRLLFHQDLLACSEQAC